MMKISAPTAVPPGSEHRHVANSNQECCEQCAIFFIFVISLNLSRPLLPDVHLLGQTESIVNLDPQIANGAFLAVPPCAYLPICID